MMTRALWLGYALALVHLCLYPWQFDFTRSLLPAGTPWWPVTRGEWVDCVVNLAIYVPFGALSYLNWPRGFAHGARLALAAAAAGLLSCGIEYVQAFVPGRVCSLRDAALNTLGAAAGAALAPYLASENRRAALPTAFCGLGLTWAFWQAFPFLPLFRYFKLSEAFERLLHPQFSAMAMGDTFLTAAALWTAGAAAPLSIRLAAVFGPLAAAALVSGLSLAQDRLLAAAAGCAAARWFSGRGFAICGLLWILCRQLYPWTWQDTATPFQWAPFAGVTHSVRDSYLRILAGKLLLYTAVIWRGGKWVAAGVLLVLAVTEAVQTHLPGRSPESTDLVLALVALLTLSVGDDSVTSADSATGSATPNRGFPR